ncbi:hypothetical protein AXG93_2852s1450 [Marchantia polymorpha subsp. ruderalis]|uniref:Uncharacterized protein n=1 Tax=Marchantia polymorpha subsp. ruderalis TaxID=1480154 RepID=A0A176WMF3_MARPO|nr:hypothetical protein AXG93_2852s1450 [Marchantia polymorpha subsp. ruderalis]
MLEMRAQNEISRHVKKASWLDATSMQNCWSRARRHSVEPEGGVDGAAAAARQPRPPRTVTVSLALPTSRPLFEWSGSAQPPDSTNVLTAFGAFIRTQRRLRKAAEPVSCSCRFSRRGRQSLSQLSVDFEWPVYWDCAAALLTRIALSLVLECRAWEEIYRNQVLVSSAVAGILGQLVKPVSSAASGKGFNLKLIIKPGGMPSTHSAVVTAAATAMGLERGFSDSLFGFSVIVAALFMYDAQGVRRSVGKQAEVINTIVLTQLPNPVPESSSSSSSPPNPSPYSIGAELARDPVQAELKFMEEADSSVSTAKASKSTAVYNDPKVNGTPSFSTQISDEKSVMNGSALGRTQGFFEAAESLPSVKDGQVTLQELGNLSGWRHIPLKESVGHTKFEVLIGAIWGIAVTLALHSSFQF